jgi:H+/Cl- antiporter ClcA
LERYISESTVLFVSMLKWVFLSTIVGVIVGLATTGFLKLLNISITGSKEFDNYFLLLPVAFFVSTAIIKYLVPEHYHQVCS